MSSSFRDADKGRSRLRLAIMIVVGAIVGVTVGATTSWWNAPVAGWAAASLVFIVWVWLVISRLDSAASRQHATREDPGNTISEFLVLLASVGSLAAVATLLIHAGTVAGAQKAVVAALGLASVALSWVLIHTLFTLRYARVYYTPPEGGIDFNSPDEDPRYVDFAYLAFDLGMTYQVSDTNLRTSQLRAIVLRHSLLSYIFGTVVLATTINLVVGLGG
ncbi:MAG TPA: DUF1345 domain-containing protein [Microbacteriaceae bacterium]